MSHTDLRDWLEAVESRGELEQVSGANWDLEISSIAELVYREGKDPNPSGKTARHYYEHFAHILWRGSLYY